MADSGSQEKWERLSHLFSPLVGSGSVRMCEPKLASHVPPGWCDLTAGNEAVLSFTRLLDSEVNRIVQLTQKLLIGIPLVMNAVLKESKAIPL